MPGSVSDESLESCLPSLLERLEKEIDPQTPVILIKASVYDTCYAALVEKGYKVYNGRLPFPGSGQQKVFREKFAKAIASL